MLFVGIHNERRAVAAVLGDGGQDEQADAVPGTPHYFSGLGRRARVCDRDGRWLLLPHPLLHVPGLRLLVHDICPEQPLREASTYSTVIKKVGRQLAQNVQLIS